MIDGNENATVGGDLNFNIERSARRPRNEGIILSACILCAMNNKFANQLKSAALFLPHGD